MKVFALFFVVVFAFVAFAYADDTCSVDGKTLKKGESYKPTGECIEKKCAGNGILTAVGCPPEAAAPHCKPVPEDTSKPFPSCCPSFDCK